MNWKETPSSEVRSVVQFLTIENNSRGEVYRCLRAACEEENVKNLRNVQGWLSVFQEGRTNVPDKEYEG